MKATRFSIELDELYNEAQKILLDVCDDGVMLMSYEPGEEEEADDLADEIYQKLEDIRDMIVSVQRAIADDPIELE